MASIEAIILTAQIGVNAILQESSAAEVIAVADGASRSQAAAFRPLGIS